MTSSLRVVLRSTLGLFSTAIVIAGFAISVGQPTCAQAPSAEAKTSANSNVEEFSYEAGITAFDDFQLAVNGKLKARQFDELDQLATKLRTGKVRWPGSRWKLGDFYEGLEYPTPGLNNTEQDWQNHLRLLEQWKGAKPQSITARVALAGAYVKYGYDARGDGYSNTVSESGWDLFHERVKKAELVLQEAATLKEKCPHWYAISLEVAMADGWSRDKTMAMFEKAIAFEPQYYEYYHDVAQYLQPKWYGETGDTEAFAKQSADRLGGDEGDVLYFQLAFSQTCSCPPEPILKAMSWDRIKKGYEASERLYGKSLMRINQMAYISTKVRDVISADDAFKRMSDRWTETVWHNQGVFENWRDWVARAAPEKREEEKWKLEISQNMATAEGKQHRDEFQQLFGKHISECGSNLGDEAKAPFRVMIQLAQDGTPIAFTAEPWTDVWRCLVKFVPMKPGTLSPAPRNKYWIALDIDPKAVQN